MKKILFSGLCVIVVTLCASYAFAISVWFSPSAPTIEAGGSFDLVLIADNREEGFNEAITQFGLEILFDENLLILDAVTNSGDWPVLNLLAGNILQGGVGPYFIAYSGDELILATLHFTCLGPGLSTIGLAGALENSNAFELWDWFSDPTYYDWTFTPAMINQTGGSTLVPEPSMWLLTCLGLVGLAVLQRRRKQ